MTLEPGQSIDLDTRVDGGMVLTRDPAGDVLAFERVYREVSEYEVKRMAEAFGLEVNE